MPAPIRALRSTLSRLLLLLTTSATLAGCTLSRLDQEADAFYQSTVLAGRIDASRCDGQPLVVAAHDAALRPVHRAWLHQAGGFELIVPPGTYGVTAFCDTNRNGRPDAGEPAGAWPADRPVTVADTGIVAMIDFAVPSPVAPGVTAAMAGWPAFENRHSTQAGSPLDFDDPAFSAENGRHGYWAPMDFFQKTGGNIYFLEPYDPARVPVLFVHGATGSAQDGRALLQSLDRSRYQAWVYQYPSGAAVESMAYLLYWKLLNLQLQYRFERMHIVAHSMGGLVVRTYLSRHAAQMGPWQGTFVSLSTPWGGEASADIGVKHAPAVVPSWRDMQPDGAFMQSLFARPLPPGVDHVLLFGYRGSPGLTGQNNDGSVTLESQLRGPAQAEARMVHGFDEDHVSILRSPRVLKQVQSLLDESGNAPSASVGHVAPTFHVSGGTPGAPWLLLRRVGAEPGTDAETIELPLRVQDNGRALGPVPAGVYDASLVAAAFGATPRTRRVTITAGATAALDFTLAPVGELMGWVAAPTPDPGQPAGSVRPPHRGAPITAIALTGPAGTRQLVPRHDKTTGLEACLSREADDARNGAFCFLDLAEGDYELKITATGFQTHVSRHRVVPGQPAPIAAIVLQPAAAAR